MMIASQMPSVAEIVQTFRLDLAAKLAIAILAGGAVGLERQIAGKPAGLRTNILICAGSALLMDLSIAIGTLDGGPRIGDPGRMAAQVITGIGFLGAGTIMQARGTIRGLTSAATIWIVAAIGLAAGAGFFVEALGTTVMVMVVLSGLGRLEHRLLRASRTLDTTVRTRPGTPFDWLCTLLFADGLRVRSHKVFDHEDDRVFELVLTGPSNQFDIARETLLKQEQVLNVLID